MNNIYQLLDNKHIEMSKKMKEPVVLIDLSNYIFHRFHAVSAWCKISDTKFETNQQYIDMYERMFEKHLLNIKKKCKCEWTNLFLLADCPREEIWRNQYYTDYKKNRDLKVKQELIPEVFGKTYSSIIPRLQTSFKFNLIRSARAEADDIVGVLKMHIRDKYSTRPIVIISNDNDYIQLIDNHTKVYNHAFKNLLERIPKEILNAVDENIIGNVFLTYKILKGDISDNITPVSKMSNKKMLSLVLKTKEDEFEDCMLNEKFKQMYDRNNLLINLSMTPNDIKEDIIKKLRNV